MKITFKSTILNNGSEEPKVIEFTAPVEISEENGFKVYEFEEPQNKVMNRIEVKDTIVNIFAGPSTIVLSLNELVQNDYYTEAGSVLFDSELKKLSIEENKVLMEYELGQLNNPFGKFKIELFISE